MIAITTGTCACGYRGTLINGGCSFCSEASKRQDDGPKVEAPARSVNALFAALVAELEEDCPAPLSQRLTLGHVWIDLCRLAGETPPAHVLALLDESAAVAPTLRLTDRRGSFREWREQFFEPA
jgi:hypothetical protein